MRIAKFEISNVLRVRSVKAELGSTLEITGRNQQGKSSVLYALWLALKFEDARKQVKGNDIIHKDELEGVVQVELEDPKLGRFLARRRFRRTKTEELTTALEIIPIEGAEDDDNVGSPMPAPQTFLDQFLGRHALDITMVSQLTDSERNRLILETGGVADEFDALQNREHDAYQQRLMYGRDLRKLGEPEPVERVEEIDPAEHQRVLDKARGIEEQMALVANKRDVAKSKREQAEQRISDLREEIARLELSSAQHLKEEKKADQQVRQLKDQHAKLKIEDARNAIVRAKEVNAQAEAYRRYTEVMAQVNDLKKGLAKWDREVTKVREEIIALLNDADLPEGVGYDPDERVLTYNGHRYLSQQQRLEFAFELMRRHKRDLPLILIRDGAYFDKDQRAEICRRAEEYGYQLLIETVSVAGERDGENVIRIEDGEVAG